jgi:Pentapeptide repeats (9 copies)
MQRVDLKDSLQDAANDAMALRKLLSDNPPLEIIEALGKLDLPVFNKLLQTAYGAPQSEQRNFFRELTHAGIEDTEIDPVSQDDNSDSFNVKIYLYALWIMVCPFEQIDHHQFIKNGRYLNFDDSLRINIWMHNVINYYKKIALKGWVSIQTENMLMDFLAELMSQRKACGDEKIYINLAETDLRQGTKGSENYHAANMEAVNFSGSIVFMCNFSQANLINANFSQAAIFSCDLSNANLSGADFSSAEIEDMDLSSVDFTNAKLHKTRFVNVNFFDNKLHPVHQLTILQKYENHPDFEVLRSAVLENFLTCVNNMEFDGEKVRILQEALKSRFFGLPRTEGRRKFNGFFSDTQINYAENALYTDSQRKIKKIMDALSKKIRNQPPLVLTPGESILVFPKHFQ